MTDEARDPVEQQTEKPEAPRDDMWVAAVEDLRGDTMYVVFDGRTPDATYATREQAEGRIEYIRRGGDGF